jgi:hypothetical protein
MSSDNLNLVSLPSELLRLLVAHTIHLDLPKSYFTLISLRLTHSIFASIVPVAALRGAHEVLADHYLDSEIQQHFDPWDNQLELQFQFNLQLEPVNPASTIRFGGNRFPCYICLRVLQRDCFAYTQTHKRRGLGHSEAKSRFCLNCAVRKGIYGKGSVVKMGGAGHGKGGAHKVVCVRCGEIGDAVMRDGRDEGCCKICVEAGWLDAMGLGVVKSRDDGVVARGADEMGLVARQGFVDDVHARSTRCQRCWAIDHTQTRAVSCSGDQLLCVLCWERNEGGAK